MLLKLIVMLFFGLLAGWTNETTSLAMSVMLLAFIIYYKLRKIRIVPWMISGWIGNIAGGVFQLLAPGNSVRLNREGRINVIEMIKNIQRTTFKIANFWGILFIMCAMIGFWYFYPRWKERCLKRNLCDALRTFSVPLIYLAGFFVSAYSLIVLKVVQDRVYSSSLIFLLIVLLSFYVKVSSAYKNKAVRHAQVFFVFVFTLYSLSVYKEAYSNAKKVHMQFNNRERLIEEAVEKGKDEVRIPTIRDVSDYTCHGPYGDLAEDPDKWPNNDMARYYGISKIIMSD